VIALAHVPPVGIGHLTMLDVAPPDLVTVAHEAGFDAVGIRAATASPVEEAWPMRPGSPMLRETRRRLDDTGLQVLDVEIIRMTPDTDPTAYGALFETGAELGASFVNVLADDPDFNRARDNFAAIAQDAGRFGIRPVLEAMIYTRVRNLDDACSIVADSGGGITVDPLHLRRFGGIPRQLRTINRALLLYYQLCDAPLAPPTGLPRPRRLARGQSLDIDDLAFEARAARLLPGEGELPLAEIVAAMPTDIPVSVEAPNQAMFDELGAARFARRARRSVDHLLRPTGARPGGR
jgi:sugar phosphate isomerase/epimerase